MNSAKDTMIEFDFVDILKGNCGFLSQQSNDSV